MLQPALSLLVLAALLLNCMQTEMREIKMFMPLIDDEKEKAKEINNY